MSRKESLQSLLNDSMNQTTEENQYNEVEKKLLDLAYHRKLHIITTLAWVESMKGENMFKELSLFDIFQLSIDEYKSHFNENSEEAINENEIEQMKSSMNKLIEMIEPNYRIIGAELRRVPYLSSGFRNDQSMDNGSDRKQNQMENIQEASEMDEQASSIIGELNKVPPIPGQDNFQVEYAENVEDMLNFLGSDNLIDNSPVKLFDYVKSVRSSPNSQKIHVKNFEGNQQSSQSGKVDHFEDEKMGLERRTNSNPTDNLHIRPYPMENNESPASKNQNEIIDRDSDMHEDDQRNRNNQRSENDSRVNVRSFDSPERDEVRRKEMNQHSSRNQSENVVPAAAIDKKFQGDVIDILNVILRKIDQSGEINKELKESLVVTIDRNMIASNNQYSTIRRAEEFMTDTPPVTSNFDERQNHEQQDLYRSDRPHNAPIPISSFV